jgi:hypothetical protein
MNSSAEDRDRIRFPERYPIHSPIHSISFRADYIQEQPNYQPGSHAGDVDLCVNVETGEVIEPGGPFELIEYPSTLAKEKF